MHHHIAPDDVARIVAALDAAGVDAIEVAHGLAGGSLNYRPGSRTDWEWIEAAADSMESATLTTLLLPGIGTVAELEHAYSLGVRSVLGCHPLCRGRCLGPSTSPRPVISAWTSRAS